jgi:hypothetical protein
MGHNRAGAGILQMAWPLQGNLCAKGDVAYIAALGTRFRVDMGFVRTWFREFLSRWIGACQAMKEAAE